MQIVNNRYLIGARDSLDDPQLYGSCLALSTLVGKAEVSPLLVVLYAQLLRGQSGSDPLPDIKNVPELFWEYVKRLNAVVTEGRKSNSEVHHALRIIGRASMSQSFQPGPCPRDSIVGAISANAESGTALLHYLEEKLALIEILPGETLVRFVLDPLAEFYAAFFFFEEGARDEREWNRFIAFTSDKPENLHLCISFCRAIVSVARSNASGILHIPETARAEIRDIENWMQTASTSDVH